MMRMTQRMIATIINKFTPDTSTLRDPFFFPASRGEAFFTASLERKMDTAPNRLQNTSSRNGDLDSMGPPLALNNLAHLWD